jgi:hypothetical protein
VHRVDVSLQSLKYFPLTFSSTGSIATRI